MQGIHAAAGTPVYDAADKKIGTVHTYDAQSGYLAVRTGWLGRKARYVHQSVVRRSDVTGVSLQLSAADLTATHYDFPWPHSASPPVGLAHTTPSATRTPSVGGGDQSAVTMETTITDAQAAPPAPLPRFSSLDG